MYKPLPPDNRTEDEKAESYRYWAKQSDAVVFDEIARLSVEHYGVPTGDIHDGPVTKYRILPDGTREVIRTWSGPNPLRHE